MVITMTSFTRQPRLWSLLLLLFCYISTNSIEASPFRFGFGRASIHKQKHPRVFATHPNPDPDWQDLEDSATTEDIDFLLNELIDTNGGGGMLLNPYVPSRRWLYRQWSDSVLAQSIPQAAWNMWGTALVCLAIRYLLWRDLDFVQLPQTMLNSSPPPHYPIVLEILQCLHVVWKSMTTLTTFLVVVFLSHAFSFWRSILEYCRAIQGHLDDLHLLLATHAARRKGIGHGSYSSEAQFFLQDLTAKLNAYHIFLWATHARRFRVLLTEKGLSRMVAKGILTMKEKEALDRQLWGVPRDQAHYILLEWILFQAKEARRRKIIDGGVGMEQAILSKFCALRECSSQIKARISARMPLPYIHMVHVLLDLFLILAPLAQFSELGIFTVLSSGILTLFYSAVFSLATIFLDPLDNEGDFRDGYPLLDLAVLVRESNWSSSILMNAARILRWKGTQRR